MPRSIIVALVSFLSFLLSFNAIAKTAAEVFEKASQSIVVVQIQNEKGNAVALGSGVILPGGDVVTNCHVIDKAVGIKVYQSAKAYNAVPRYLDYDRDVCSLLVPDINAPSVSMGSTKTLKVGSRVYAIGAPKGLTLTLSEGIISSLRSVEGGQYLQITAPISHGSSGGGLFDEEGRLIGLTSFYIAEGQQLNFAIPVEWIVELPKRHKKESKAVETYAAWLDKAIALEEKKNWDALINHALKRIIEVPQSANAWFTLGLAHGKAGHTQKAIEAYQEALRIDPKYVNAWNDLGTIYYDTGQTSKAIDAFRQALRINPENAKSWYNLGVFYGDSGQTQKAIEAYQEALRIDPEYAKPWCNLGNAYKKIGQTSKAIEAYRQALQIDSEDAIAWYNLGNAYGQSIQLTKAIEGYQQALRINPRFVDALFQLGITYQILDQKKNVTEVYKRLKTIDPEKADEFFNKVLLP